MDAATAGFLAAAGLFLGLLAWALLRRRGVQEAPATPARFVPHAFLMAALGLAALAILAALLAPAFRR